MGKSRSKGGAERALDPAAALSVGEAARLVDRSEAEIEQLLAAGSLLSESRRMGGKDVLIIRAVDLREAFPGAFGEVAGAAEFPVEPAASASVPAPEQEHVAPSGLASEPIVDAVRTSGATRDALIELCQDMETRLDLAERERQASTAALLMAQRRVLDLEVQMRRQPWARAGGIFAAVASAVAVFIALRAPQAAREAVVEELSPLRDSAIEGIRAAGQDLSSQWEESLEAERTASERQRARFDETLQAAKSSAERSFEAAQGVAASSAASMARVEGQAKGALDAIQADRVEAARERQELLAALDDLERRLETAEETSRKRSAELEVAHDHAGRDRMRFRERLGEAERLLEDARLAMGAGRRAQADEHERLRQTTARLEAALAKVEARGVTQPAGSPRTDQPKSIPAGPARRPLAPPTEGDQRAVPPKAGPEMIPEAGPGDSPENHPDNRGKVPREGAREGAGRGSTLGSILRALFG